MDPRFLPFQIAAGLLLAGLVILMLRLGMNIYRNNRSFKGAFGAVLFLAGMVSAWAVLIAGFNV